MEELICIRCPIGCQLRAEKQGDTWSVTGNRCKRGEEYAREELTRPTRIVTCLLLVEGAAQPLSVKTDGGIPKDKIFDCIRAIKRLRLKAPVQAGSVLLEDVCQTGVCVRATKSV